MKPVKELVLLTAATIIVSEVVSSREVSNTLTQPHDHREMATNSAEIGTNAVPIFASGGQHQYAVIKVKGAEPEVFWLAAIRHPEFTNGKFMETSTNLTESELRSELAKLGCSENEGTFLIAKARMYPS